MNLFLDNYDLTKIELCTSFLCPTYGLRHWAKGSSDWRHYAIAVIQLCPAIGPLASAVEWIAFKIFGKSQPKEEIKEAGEKLLFQDKPVIHIEVEKDLALKQERDGYFLKEGQIYRIKNGKKTVYERGKVIGKGQGAEVRVLNPLDPTKRPKAAKIYFKNDEFDQKETELEIFTKVKWPQKAVGVQIPKAMLQSDEETIMVMSLYDGPLEKKVTDLSKQEQISAIDQLIQGVAEAHHKKVVHGEINLENILVREKKGHLECKLTDFGCGAANVNVNRSMDILTLFCVMRAIILKSQEGGRSIKALITEKEAPEDLKNFHNSIFNLGNIDLIQAAWKKAGLKA